MRTPVRHQLPLIAVISRDRPWPQVVKVERRLDCCRDRARSQRPHDTCARAQLRARHPTIATAALPERREVDTRTCEYPDLPDPTTRTTVPLSRIHEVRLLD